MRKTLHYVQGDRHYVQGYKPLYHTIVRLRRVLLAFIGVGTGLGVGLPNLLVPAAFALPQFTAEYKQSCQLCHQNPTGGGMRALYGAQFISYMELPVKALEDFTKLEDIQPKLGNNVQVGADFRSMFFTMAQDTNASTFFTMQGDLYLAFMPTERATLYLDRGLSSLSEAFLLLQGFPMSGALRAGKFVPAYGWRFEDHKAFVREKLGFSPQSTFPLSPDHGVELGFYPMEWEASLALTNGMPGPFDGDDDKAVTARAAGRLSVGSLNLTAGGSYRYAEVGRARPLRRYFGPLGGVNWRGFTYLGEADWVVSGTTALVTSHLVSCRLQRGVYLSGHYDFYDPDLDYKSGASTRYRFSSELFLTGYLELIPAYELNEDKTPAGTRKYGTGELQLHFWF